MLTLDEIKRQLYVEHDEDDVLFAGYMVAATDYLSSIGVDMTADPLPPSIRQAELLLVGHWFRHREATSDAGRGTASVPFSVDALIAPHRRWTA